jgi:hypothetical protein
MTNANTMFARNLKERDHLGDLVVDGWMISNRSYKVWCDCNQLAQDRVQCHVVVKFRVL